MSADDLLAELTACFQHEPYPGDDNLVTNNEPGYDLEALQIRDTFQVHTWQTLPDALMLHEQGGYFFLSKRGLKYYLPAYLGFAVRAYAEADSIPDGLIFSLTLPTAQDEVAIASNEEPTQLQAPLPAGNEQVFSQTRPEELAKRVSYFLDRHGQFGGAQGRAIYHFLVFMRENYGHDYFNDEPNVAIQRYWFQFA